MIIVIVVGWQWEPIIHFHFHLCNRPSEFIDKLAILVIIGAFCIGALEQSEYLYIVRNALKGFFLKDGNPIPICLAIKLLWDMVGICYVSGVIEKTVLFNS